MSGAGQERPGALFEKGWDEHLVLEATPETPAILYVELHPRSAATSPIRAGCWAAVERCKRSATSIPERSCWRSTTSIRTTSFPADITGIADIFGRYCLLEGVDQLAFLRQHEDRIGEFENERALSP